MKNSLRAAGITLALMAGQAWPQAGELYDAGVAEQAVFAISQLPGESGSKMLMDLVTDSQAPREVRRQALFWLANSDDDNAVAALADLLSK